MKKVFILSILFATLSNLNSQEIVNEGVFRVDGTNTAVSFFYDYTNKSTGTHENKGNLYIHKNFTNNGTMTLNDVVNGTTRFVSAISAQEIKGNSAVIFKNMEMLKFVSIALPSSVVSVADGLELRVLNNLALTIGSLRLIGDAQLVQTHSGVSQVSGNSKLFKDQQAKVPNVYRYHYWSSPVTQTLGSSTYKVGSVLRDGIDPVSTTSTYLPPVITWTSNLDGAPSSGTYPSSYTPITLSNYWIYTNLNDIGDGSSWVQKFETGDINVGQGFSMKSTGTVPQNFTFIGTPNDGDIFFNINASPATHLLGNPYPSALDITDFINDNISSIDGTLYFWEHTGEDFGNEGHYQAGYQGGYSQRNLTMGISARGLPNPNSATFDWENAVDNGNEVNQLKTITIESTNYNFTASVTIDEPSGVDIVDKLGAGVTSGNTIVKSGGNSSKSFEVTFDNIIDISSIYLYNDITSSTSQNSITITANNIARNQPVTQILTGNNGQSFNLNWTDVTSFTITSTNPNNIVMDNIEFSKGGGISLGNGTYHAPNRYMAVGQGFFVSASATGGQIVFKNSQREFRNNDFSNGGTFFFKEKKKEEQISILKLGMNFKNNSTTYHRQIGISFKNGNTFNYENGYDSEMFDLSTTDMFWKFDQIPNKNLIIAGVEEITNELEVPVSFVIDKSQTIKVMIDEIENIDKDVFLLDKFTGNYYSLLNSVELDLEKGNYSGRFFLTFKKKTLSLQEENLELEYSLSVYVDNLSNEIIIQNNKRIILEEIKFYNIIGQKLYESKTFKDSLQTKIKISKRRSSFYILSIKTNKGMYRKKIFIK